MKREKQQEDVCTVRKIVKSDRPTINSDNIRSSENLLHSIETFPSAILMNSLVKIIPTSGLLVEDE
jgi:hypothetical protein